MIEKHLYEAGWDPDKETAQNFKAERDIDWENAQEQHLNEALRDGEYREHRQREQIMQSAVDPSLKTADGKANWQTEKVRAGAKFYALTTVADDEHGWKNAESAYWFSEAEVRSLEREKLIDIENRKIEAAIIKNRYAIPCSNKVNGLVEAKVVEDHEVVRTTVGAATDIYIVDNKECSRWMEGGGHQWHPNVNSLKLDRSRNLQRLAEQAGQVADYRSFEIHYAPAERKDPIPLFRRQAQQRDMR